MVDKVRQHAAPTLIEPLDGPTMLSPSDSRVVTPKAARQISETLKKRILAGEFPPGSYLPAAGLLLEEFGVSRPTLREALNALETDGLIQLRRGPNGGAIVQNPDNAAIIRQLQFLLRFEGTTIEELMDVRLVVDPLAARLAAERGDNEDIARIGQSLERQRDKEMLKNHEAWPAMRTRRPRASGATWSEASTCGRATPAQARGRAAPPPPQAKGERM
jgi:GntR family transcriptional regulator, transcriptional repressor for pyruvate dehydrogenase complex